MMTLISSDNAKENVRFNDYDDPYNHDPEHEAKFNDYSLSDLKKGVEAVAATFGEGERSAIRTRDLASGSYDGLNTDCISGDEVKGALLWPLSTKEAASMDMSLRALAPVREDGTYA